MIIYIYFFEYSWWCLFIYPAYIMICIFIEILFRKLISKSSEFVNPRDYSYKQIKEEIDNGQMLFIYENTVIDAKKFIYQHPGKNLLDNYIGTEISRYIYGGFPCGNGLIYLHSESTNEIIERLKCGNVIPLFSLLFTANNNIQSIDSDMRWKVTSRENVTSVHKIIRFSCGTNKINGIIPGVNHCGCYISVCSKQMNVARNYSYSFMNNQELFKAHANLPNALASASHWRPLCVNIGSFSKDYLEICVKKQRLFSKWLHEMELSDDEFEIRGPFVFFIIV